MATFRLPRRFVPPALLASGFCAPCQAAEIQAASRAETERQMNKSVKKSVRVGFASDLAVSADVVAAPSAGATTPVPDDATVPDAGDVAWSGVLAQEGTATGDGRLIMPGALTWDTLPLMLRWCPIDNGSHDGAVTIGKINNIGRDDAGNVTADGVIDTTIPEGADAVAQMKRGLLSGVSVDLDDMDVTVKALAAAQGEPADPTPDADGYVTVYDGNMSQELMQINSARMRAATLVAIPAFEQARLTLDPAPEPITAAGAKGIALSERDAPWDAAAARKTLGDDPAAAAWAFFVHDGPANEWGSYHLPFGKMENGNRVAVWRGVTAAAAAVQGGRGATGFSSAKPSIAGYYAKARTAYHDPSIQVPWDGSKSATGTVALVASALPIPVDPPADWFAKPHFDGPTALTFTDDGRVYGHIAVFDTCHTGYAQQCVKPPKSATNYAWFNVGALRTADGTEVTVGHITMDTGHAGPRMGAAPAMAHYDHTGTVVADVHAGEDKFGIYVAGALRPGVTPERLRALRSAPMSGDWRATGKGGNLELLAILAVNLPGFPVPREARALVASGAVTELALPIQTNPTNAAFAEEEVPVPKPVAGSSIRIPKAGKRFAQGNPKNVESEARLKKYWLTGAGAAKIRWGEPCDFCRCRNEVTAAIVKGGHKPMPPAELSGFCANLHKTATGTHPGGEDNGHHESGPHCPECEA